ncbi:hypothetical protein ALI144C_07825 [Actinosynnema sp. ALI-1.44]|uniref:hypothetical protein n=1 Tax=Actinosynnema sp. ALI-1.44 TaxID=1933779 RepID=UPI00097C5042|nr:hypothetical protein [Actinosynnema sp. ALI-1.44]ONI87842.1 hypothetical protein ALI144C_07825 [Actinosynnema sp. ALI-1.44]
MTTKLDIEAIKQAAVSLGRIMDDMSAFAPLRAPWPTIGNFDLARRLEGIVDDRRDGVVAHAHQLQASLDEMGKVLTRIATRFEAVDNSNAKEIAAVIPGVPARRPSA